MSHDDTIRRIDLKVAGVGAEPRERLVSLFMYHYVRDTANSPFPEIKALSIKRFQWQLDFLSRHFNIIDPAHLIAALHEGAELPRRAAMLTFDDGYSDHYENVFPILMDRKLSGLFFPPAIATSRTKLLEVNKIHFILAASSDKAALAHKVAELVKRYAERSDVRRVSEYLKEYAVADRFDSADVIFVKRMLQIALPDDVSSEVTDDLFRSIVSSDELGFAEHLYASVANWKEMLSAGMMVGGHGVQHVWMDKLDAKEQAHEVSKTLDFLTNIGVDVNKGWSMCYPYGGYDASLVSILREQRCIAAFTTEVRTADIVFDNPLMLPRLDTRDLPAEDGYFDPV